VHRDFSFQPYLNAALILLQFAAKYGDDVLSPANPYRGSCAQFGDITFGAKTFSRSLPKPHRRLRKAAYFQEWMVHRRLRPEAFAGRIEMHIAGRKAATSIPICLIVTGCKGARPRSETGCSPWPTPRMSDTHPAAHAHNAGACGAVLKVFFNQEFPLPAPVQANDDGSALEPWRGT
jgi:hypothetical protein